MEFVELLLNDRGYYSYRYASNDEMSNLGIFLATDVGCNGRSFFRDWALADKEDPTSGFTHIAGGNATFLDEEDDGYIYMYDDTERPRSKSKSLKISRTHFVKLLDDWQEKICKAKPKKVIIKQEHGEFIIETKD